VSDLATGEGFPGDRSEFTTADGVTLRFWCHGSGPPLYVCHGGPRGDHSYLAREIAPLGDEVTLVFHDYRGSGASDRAAPDSYTFAQLADDIDELRRHRRDDEIVALGHSMGVPVALHYALQHPRSLTCLALSGGTPISPTRLSRAIMRSLGAARSLIVCSRTASYVVWWSWRSPSPARNAALMRLSKATGESRRKLRRDVPGPAIDENDNSQRLQRALLGVDLTDAIAEVRCPVLVLYGERDALAAAAAARFASLPNGTFSVLPALATRFSPTRPNSHSDRSEPS
jgi:proline iminopeptidase